jgi:hypothetical protein
VRQALVTAVVMVALSYVFDNIASFFFRGSSLLFVIVGPVIEETVRYYATSRFCWTASVSKAALIGLLIGLMEVATKTFEAALFWPVPFQAFPTLMFASVSLPIHLALSLAFYAIWYGRWYKLVLLHVLINGTGYGIAVSLHSRATMLEYTAMAGGAITVLCTITSLVAIWRMKMRQIQKAGL